MKLSNFKVKEKISNLEKKNKEDMMKMKTTTTGKQVKTVSKQGRKQSISGSPTIKRLNAKNRAQYSPLKNLMTHEPSHESLSK